MNIKGRLLLDGEEVLGCRSAGCGTREDDGYTGSSQAAIGEHTGTKWVTLIGTWSCGCIGV